MIKKNEKTKWNKSCLQHFSLTDTRTVDWLWVHCHLVVHTIFLYSALLLPVDGSSL